ncbi:MAG: TIGR01777 family oxidoreductase [Pseudomonadota bacterium]
MKNSNPTLKILVTGATGLIGRKLIHSLMRQGHEVSALARSPQKLPEIPSDRVFSWSDQEVPSPEVFSKMDIVVHLAGEGIADKLWTAPRKKRLRDSRVEGTKNIVRAISMLSEDSRPKVFISASAIGFYGNSSSPHHENGRAGSGFLPELCRDWESAANQARALGLRTVLLRIGLVLAKESGFLSKAPPFILGSGSQWMSWIHIDDAVRLIDFAIKESAIEGELHLTAPTPVTNRDFMKTYSAVKGVPFLLTAPKWVIKLLTGELSQIVLSSHRVQPLKALQLGFRFQFENLGEALENLVGKARFTENFFSSRQFIPLPRDLVYAFFSKAENLEILTPPWLKFKILNQSTPEIRKGTLINYRLRIHGFPVWWRTLIAEWNPNESFVDTQLRGPYKKWYHLHTFEEVPGGTLISDDVTYEVPGWIFGKWILPLIKRDVSAIFAYRRGKIQELAAKGYLK